ncbi:YggN family protein [Vibrio sp. S11_S32]|nr:YggN family protein [Vibrio sp. S11_S32]
MRLYFMKRTLLSVALTLTSVSAMAQVPRCDINIDNELHLKNEQVSVYQQGKPKVVIDQNNDLFINGKKITLNQTQENAVKAYREKVSEYIPKAKKIGDDGMTLANQVIDDISASFNNSKAFDNVKTAVDGYYADIESRYYNNGEWVIKKDAVKDALSNWKQESAAAMQKFNGEFFSSAFAVLSEKMKTDGSVNLTELQTQMTDMKKQIETRLQSQSQQLQKEANAYCGNLHDLVSEEKTLHQQVPQLKNYSVFVE